jgi:lysozyme
VSALLGSLLRWLAGLFGGGPAALAPSASVSSEPSEGSLASDSGSAAPEQPIEPPQAPAGPRQINAAGLALVKKSEGLRLAAYQDTGGVWTIGYGHTGAYPPGTYCFPEEGGHSYSADGDSPSAGEAITEFTATMILTADLARAAASVPADVPLTDNQFAALTDFAFNLGAGALRQLLAHGLDQVPEQLLRWDHGEVAGREEELAGLKARRQAEADLWRMA